MTQPFYYKNFYQLLKLENPEDRETQLKELIDTYLCQHFYVEDRKWFNLLVNYGLLNLVKHCENTIADFSLYDNNHHCDHASNSSFLKSVQSGNIELVDYFLNHKDFNKFCKSSTIHEDVATFLNFTPNVTNFNVKNFEKLIFKLADTFPLYIPFAFNKLIINQKNDEITPALKSFIEKYHNILKYYLDNEAKENTLTRLCIISLNNDCYDLGYFLRKKFSYIKLDSDLIGFGVCSRRNTQVLDYVLNNPDFFELKPEHFTNIFSWLFSNAVSSNPVKHDFQFYFHVTKLGLHTVTHIEMQQAINKNLAPFIRKYYSKFSEENFDLSKDNTCTRFINKVKTEKMYKDYLKKYPQKNIVEKKLKI